MDLGNRVRADALEGLQRRLGYTFTSSERLEQALTHRSAHARDNYERLEFVGDALLSVIVAQYLYEQHPREDEGRLTRMRATLVRQETLAAVARDLQLGPLLRMGSGELKSGGQRRESILADVVEAIMGAMYQDSNDLSRIRECVLNWLQPYLAQALAADTLKDPKTRLQEWLQARKKPVPQYEMVSAVGESHCQVFTVACHVTDYGMEQASGNSRRAAEQTAAAQMLAQIQRTLPNSPA